jgi:hypothetical protein
MHEYSELERVRGAISGRSLSKVRYRALSPAPRLADLEAGAVHEVDSVQIELDSGIVLWIQWAMAGTDEGLHLEVDPEPWEDAGREEVDVGMTTQWAALLGQPIMQMRAAWHVSSDNGQELLWATSFRTTAGGEVSIALGEVQDRGPTYLPDSLVVIFSSAKARQYQPPASRTSAWGEVFESA